MAKKATPASSPAPARAPAPAARSTPAKAPAKAGKPTAAAAPPKAAAKGQPPAPPAPPPVATAKTIAAQMAERHGLDKRQSERLVGDIVAVLAEHLIGGSRIRLAGLGVLEIRNRPARMGRNPATGESIQIAASRKVVFRPAKEVKEAV
ncbi:MAG TPA: HU family DNA-binding protein [Acetobacteraceae bacterium]